VCWISILSCLLSEILFLALCNEQVPAVAVLAFQLSLHFQIYLARIIRAEFAVVALSCIEVCQGLQIQSTVTLTVVVGSSGSGAFAHYLVYSSVVLLL
jgi:hypothetical protein